MSTRSHTTKTESLLDATLGDDRLLRVKEMVSSRAGGPGLLPFGRDTLWRKVREGTFPAPIKINPAVTVWRLSAVKQWLDAQQHAPLSVDGGAK